MRLRPASVGGATSTVKELEIIIEKIRTAWPDVMIIARANQLRLYFSSIAYMLMQALRRIGGARTAMEKAQCNTIRLKLFKI